MPRTIELSDATYERLLSLKTDRETVADVVDRISRHLARMKLAGSMSKEDAEHYRRAIREHREAADRDRDERYRRLFGNRT